MELETLILYLTLCGTLCFPSRPLNDRPSELAWQAWLLVDSQNSYEGDRRITPKSVFIAPNIGDNGSSLPECAEGYRSDPMGRCIKFVKVDEAAHLDFLLQRLNALYATRTSADFDDDVKPTSGPLQLNIPLEDKEENPEIAIVVAPTNGQFEKKDIDKRTQEETTQITTETIPETTTELVESTTENLQALFFLLPNKTEDATTHIDQTTNENTPESEANPQDQTTPEHTTSRIKFPETPESHQLSSSEIEALFKDYISQKPDLVSLTSSEYPRRNPLENYGQIPRPQYFNPVYNHRNRDKSDFWRPVTFRDETVQKPLVLRFNRQPYSQERSSEEYYGDVFQRKRRRYR